MTLQLKPGHDLTDEEILGLEALIRQQYPDEDVEFVIEDAPQPAYQQPAPAQPPPSLFSKLMVGGVTAIAILYLVNPTAGFIELIPDNFPLIGNLDEGAAMVLLISGLSYFGVNIGWVSNIFGQGLGKRKRGE